MNEHHVSSCSAGISEGNCLFGVKHMTENEQKQLRSSQLRQHVLFETIE